MTREEMQTWGKEREYAAMRDKRPAAQEAAQEAERVRKHLVSLLMMGGGANETD